jgi:hypothetical protein
MNFCPSDSNFTGWNGNTATYNCNIPQGEVREGDDIDVVGFDFSSNCGPETGKKLRVTVERSSSSPQPTSSQSNPNNPQPTSFPQGPSNPGNVCANLPIHSWTCRNNIDCTIALLRDYLKIGISTAPSQPTPTQPPVASRLLSWLDLCNDVGRKTGVSPKMLCAIRENESGSAYNNLPEPLSNYFEPGKVLEGDRQCPISKCSETGAMQIQTGSYAGVQGCRTGAANQCGWTCVNTWGGYANAVNELNPDKPPHDPNPCNIRDNMYAAGKLMGMFKQASPYPDDEVQTIAYMMRRYSGVKPWNQRYDRATDTGCGPKYSQFQMGTGTNHSYCFYLLTKMNL